VQSILESAFEWLDAHRGQPDGRVAR
jgi:hypothetical protein